jgi:hypothetical protein
MSVRQTEMKTIKQMWDEDRYNPKNWKPIPTRVVLPPSKPNAALGWLVCLILCVIAIPIIVIAFMTMGPIVVPPGFIFFIIILFMLDGKEDKKKA